MISLFFEQMKRAATQEISRSGFRPAKKQRQALNVTVVPKPIPLNQAQRAQIQRMILKNEEQKYFDTVFNTISVSSTGSAYSLSLVPQGDDVNSRDGDSLKALNLDFRFTLSCSDATNAFRVIIYQYLENTAIQAPIITQVLDTGTITGVNVPYQFYRRKNSVRVLVDKTYNLALSTDTAVMATRWKVPIRSHQVVEYTPGATTGYNTICVALISDSVAAAHPTFGGLCRLTYTDS